MRPGRSIAVALASLVSAAALSACGSGSGSGTITAVALSRAEFLKKASTICAEGTKAIDTQYDPWAHRHLKKANRDKIMDQVAAEVVIPARKKEVDRMRALGVPEGGKGQIEAFLVALEKGIAQGEREHSSLRGGGRGYSFQRALEIAGDLGLEACFVG